MHVKMYLSVSHKTLEFNNTPVSNLFVLHVLVAHTGNTVYNQIVSNTKKKHRNFQILNWYIV